MKNQTARTLRQVAAFTVVFLLMLWLPGCHGPGRPTTTLLLPPAGNGDIPVVAYRVLVEGDSPGSATNVGCRLTDAEVRDTISTLSNNFSLYCGTGAFQPVRESPTGDIYIHDIWVSQTTVVNTTTANMPLFWSISNTPATYGPLDRFTEFKALYQYINRNPWTCWIDLGYPHIPIYFTSPLWLKPSVAGDPWNNGAYGITVDPGGADVYRRLIDDSIDWHGLIALDDGSFDAAAADRLYRPNRLLRTLAANIGTLMTPPNDVYRAGIPEHEMAHYLGRLDGLDQGGTFGERLHHYKPTNEHAFFGSVVGNSPNQYPNLLKETPGIPPIVPMLWEGKSAVPTQVFTFGRNDRGHTSSRILRTDTQGKPLWSVP
jgi:hypothetical protein